jgi:hypothetical protein
MKIKRLSTGGAKQKGCRISSFFLALVFAVILVGPVCADGPTPPIFHYWHMWTDNKGVSHMTRFAMRNFVLESMNPPADPQWQDRLKANGATVIITVQPVGWRGSWHEDPKPQWIVPLSGRWFVQTMDGKRVEMGAGDICFGEDQNTRSDAQGHKGHFSGTIGTKPAVLMVVQLKDPPTVNQPGHFK